MFHRSLVRLAVVAGLLTAIVVPTAVAATRTTEPGVLYPVKVTISDTEIVIAHARYPRGAIIQYRVKNIGTRKHAFMVATQRTRTIEPGGKAILLVVFDVRGKIPYKSPVKADAGVKGLKGFIRID